MKFGGSIKHLWNLKKDVYYLNHGSFGATPIEVTEEEFKIVSELESSPVHFFIDDFYDRLRAVAGRLGNFVGTDGVNIGFVDNATTGVNTVLNSLYPILKPGDEILTTNHGYPAVLNALRHFSKVSGAKLNIADIPFPIDSKKTIIDIFEKSITAQTRLAVFDHITSPTAIIYPVKELIDLCKSKGIMTLVDGAHTPGMISLNIDNIKPDWFTGNCHKWLFAPKGCAMLYTSPEYQEITHPLTISLRYGEGYTQEFDWTGTKNPAPFFALNKAIEFYEKMDAQASVKEYIRELSIAARALLEKRFDTTATAPSDIIGSMGVIPMPGNQVNSLERANQIRYELYHKYNIEIPIFFIKDRLWVRYSAQIYNEISEYEYLAEVLDKNIR